jgi:hypothetical protein
MQDVFVSYEGPHPTDRGMKEDMPYERFCLEKADGIVGECLEIQNAYREYKILHKPANLFFPLYCDSDQFLPKKNAFNPNEIHLVYAGQVHGSWRKTRQHGPTQFFKIIDMLAAQKIHLHLYPSPGTQRLDSEEYEVLARSLPYLHYHQSVPQEVLAEELSQYDFGIVPFFKAMGGPSDVKFKYATTLKIFNYWESGLPIIASADLFYQSWLVERHHAGIVVNNLEEFGNLNEIIKNTDYNALSRHVIETRNKLALVHQVPRLYNFYKKIAAH